ncbi:MAG: adenine phosphoribosyltransferase [Bacteroidia bacterium]
MIEEKLKKVIRAVPDFPKPGILFRDITPVLQNPQLCLDVVAALLQQMNGNKVDVIAAVESRGFLFGMLLARELKIPFVPVRKAGKLPYKTISHSYDLEYGSATVEVHEDAISAGSNVLIHDDLLATGGTAVAAAELMKKLGGNVAGFSFIISLIFLEGRKTLIPYSNNIIELVKY